MNQVRSMARNAKLFQRLDQACSELTVRVLEEFGKPDKGPEASSYLARKRRVYLVHREYRLRGKEGSTAEANELLTLEKEILHLCEKLNEPLPAVLEIVDAYADAYRDCRVGRPSWDNEVADADHKKLIKAAIAKLRELVS